jgi:hypothetical protein
MPNSCTGITFGVGSRKGYNQMPLSTHCRSYESTATKAFSRIERENEGEQVQMIGLVAQYYGGDVNAMKYVYVHTDETLTDTICLRGPCLVRPFL